MNFARNLLFFTSISTACLLLDACSKKHYICPAYNSYFIHDRAVRDSRFSPFIADSVNNNYDETFAINQDTTTSSNQATNDANAFAQGNSKFQPKEKLLKKAQPNGLLLANNGKPKANRGVEEIEMKIIGVKPLSRYSNVDSSSIKKSNLEGNEAAADTL